MGEAQGLSKNPGLGVRVQRIWVRAQFAPDLLGVGLECGAEREREEAFRSISQGRGGYTCQRLLGGTWMSSLKEEVCIMFIKCVVFP